MCPCFFFVMLVCDLCGFWLGGGSAEGLSVILTPSREAHVSRQVPVSLQRVERQLSCLLLSQICACLLLCVSYDGQYARYCSIPHHEL